jgi:hypothetical protein
MARMRIPGPTWELALLAGLACLGLGIVGTQNDVLFGAVFALEAGLSFIGSFYLPG